MATKEKKPKKVRKPPEPYWNDMVEVWFAYCRDKFNESPSFDGSSPRDLKLIIISLHERAEKSNLEWTLDTAILRFKGFLDFAYQDYWLQRNWLLSNINRHKDKIFYNIRAAIQKQPSNPFE